jgi:hypothetical protein
MSTIGRFSRLVDRKVVEKPNKATVVRVDQGYVDLALYPGSGTIHHVKVVGSIDQLAPGMVVPIQWTERQGGYLSPVVIATGGEAAAVGAAPVIQVDNASLRVIDGELSVKPGGIEQRHLAFVAAIDGHSHPSELALAGLQVQEGKLQNVNQDIALTGDGRIETDGLTIDGADETYRLWAGDEDPASAPFSVKADGTLAATLPADNITADTTNFTGNLGAADDTVQKALETLDGLPLGGVTNGDNHDHSGGDGGQIDHGGLAGLNDPDHPASAITVNTTNFSGNLSSADDTVQKALDTLDNMAAGDPDAIHDNVGGEISALTEKIAPVSDDLVLIEDSAASNAKKKVKLLNVIKKILPYVISDVTYYVNGNSGSDLNDGSSGAPFSTIGKAVSMFHGFAVKNCKISIAAGTYAEEVNLTGFHSDMFNGLTLEGQTNCPVAGLSFIHGDSTDTSISNSYEGAGAITLATDNSGAGGRMRVTVTRATTSPSFAGVATGSASSNRVWMWNGSAMSVYPVYAVSGNVITADSTSAAPALNTNGRYMLVSPNVIIDAPDNSESCAMEVFNMGVKIRGIHFEGYYCGLRLYSAAVMASECSFWQGYTGNWYGSVHLGSQSYLFARYDPINDAPISIIGYWAGLVASFESMSNLGSAMVHGRGTYGIYASGGQVYFNAGRCPAGTYTGVYAASTGYVLASSVNAKNWASTKFSPSTSNAFGNNNGSVTFS